VLITSDRFPWITISRNLINETDNWDGRKLKQCQLSEILQEIFVVNWHYCHIKLAEIYLRFIYSSRHCRNKRTGCTLLLYLLVWTCLLIFIYRCWVFMWNTHIIFQNMYPVQWWKPINLLAQGDWPPDNRGSVSAHQKQHPFLPLCKSSYTNCHICPYVRLSTSLNWRTDWQILTHFDISVSDSRWDSVINMVTMLWTAWPGVRIQVQEWDLSRATV
jgi:hypothetical protein